MTALAVIGVIVLALLLLGLIPIHAEATFGEAFAFTLRIAGISVLRRPKPPQTEKSTKKEKKEKPKEKQKKKRQKLTVRETVSLLKTILHALKSFFRFLWRNLKFDPFRISVHFAGSDPANVTAEYAAAAAAMQTLMPLAEERFRIPDPRLHLDVDYRDTQIRAEGKLGATLRVADAIWLLLLLAVPLLKWYLRFRKAHKDQSKEDVKNGT